MRLFISILLMVLTGVCLETSAQETTPLTTNGINRGNRQVDAQGRPLSPNTTTGKDSLQHRDDLADSITISFRYFDSSRPLRLDSSVLNLHHIVPQPYHHLYLGNLGSAARPILFTPRMYAGFDAGFHAYDLYRFSLADTRFFQTSRPYSELSYILGGSSEQTINLLFTQNFKPNYNVTFEYRFISSPGSLKNLSNNNRSIRIAVPFTTKSRRYSGNAVFISNRTSAGESGGILSTDYLNNLVTYGNRYFIPTRLGGDPAFNNNFLSSNSNITGALYQQSLFYFRHQYDFGQIDSLRTDSGYVKLFYPRFRLQHNLQVNSQSYRFRDAVTPDSLYKFFDYRSLDNPVLFQDKWTDVKNEFALILFPEKNNQNQFLKLGAAHQWLNGTLDNARLQLYNIYLFGEYRNRTRNQRWDINASGQLYSVGFNAGDYLADVRLQANLGKRFGSVQLGFQNSNRTPGFVFDNRSSFPLLPANLNLRKENITHLYGSFQEPWLGFSLSGHYYLLANYTYFNGFIQATQEATLINVLQLGAEKKWKFGRRWNLYSQLYFQQPTADAIHIPAIFTHHQLAYEGNFFRNLDLSTGVEIRYFSPFKADSYSPLTGQFVWQDTTTIRNRPDIAPFLHMRIKSFRLFIRMENLNTIRLSNGLSFTNNNFAAPLYPTPGQFLRVGIRWAFIN